MLIHGLNVLSSFVMGVVLASVWTKMEDDWSLGEGSHTSLAFHASQYLVHTLFLQGILLAVQDLTDPFGPRICGMPVAQLYKVFQSESHSFMFDHKPTGGLFSKVQAQFRRFDIRL